MQHVAHRHSDEIAQLNLLIANLEAENARLSERVRELESPWKPIEGAPKKGCGKAEIAEYGPFVLLAPGWPRDEVPAVGYWRQSLVNPEDGHWLEIGGHLIVPTHYAPLPKIPVLTPSPATGDENG